MSEKNELALLQLIANVVHTRSEMFSTVAHQAVVEPMNGGLIILMAHDWFRNLTRPRIVGPRVEKCLDKSTLLYRITCSNDFGLRRTRCNKLLSPRSPADGCTVHHHDITSGRTISIGVSIRSIDIDHRDVASMSILKFPRQTKVGGAVEIDT